MTGIHADIDALRGLHEALARFRDAQRDVADRGGDAIEVTRASLAAKAARWQARLEQCRAELDACLDRDGDCSGCARAVSEAGERLEQIRRWQQRVEEEASEFGGTAGRFRDLLEVGLPRTGDHLLAMITSLRAARRVQGS